VNVEIQANSAFETMVYTVERPEFVEKVKQVSLEYLKDKLLMSEIYPSKMGGSMESDERIQDFARFVAVTAGDILTSQGYKTEGLGAYFESMWCQEHQKFSGMDQHTHPQALIVGFYFLEVPENSSALILHDPRPGKVAVPLDIANQNEISLASSHLNIIPKEGLLVFTNSWLPHSISKNSSNKPLRFVHFNVGLTPHVENNNVEII